MRSSYFSKTSLRPRLRRNGFTLVEVLVAVAIMSLLFAVILVPLRLGFDSFNIGQTRSTLQQQAQLTLQQIGNDLRKAQFVFPNSRIAGVSDNEDQASPCAVQGYKASWNYQPYVKSTTTGETDSPSIPLPPTYGVCETNVEAWSNPARIDMLQLRRDNSGTSANSAAGQDFILSYYPRRLYIAPVNGVVPSYDIIDNPIVLFRAQIPFRNRNGSSHTGDAATSPDKNADIDWTNYPDTIGSCNSTTFPGQSNRSFLWITHNFFGEADLAPLCTDATGPVAGAHTLAIPRGMALAAPQALTGNSGSYVPELSFVQEATDGKRIDRVTINMTLTQYDAIGAASTNGVGKAQSVRVSQTFDLPSAGCSP